MNNLKNNAANLKQGKTISTHDWLGWVNKKRKTRSFSKTATTKQHNCSKEYSEQSPIGVLEKKVFLEIRRIQRKTSVLEPLF